MNELFYNNGLIPENNWVQAISALKPSNELKESEEVIASEIRRLIEEAVLNRITKIKRVGIFFSGGVDSSLIAAICKNNNIKFTCYSVGFMEGNMNIPEDIKYAQEVAKYLKLNDNEFKFKIFNIKEVEEIFRKTSSILKKIPEDEYVKGDINKIVNLGVASVEVAAHSISNGEKHFFSGIGSEEIFAGYERHKKNPSNEECINGLIKMYNRDLIRDYLVAKNLNFTFITPFLDINLIKYSLSIPIKMKINEEGNKIILRKAAEHYLKKYAYRPKKAAQYGSSFDKAISKIASKKFNTKKEYYDSLIYS